jgi:integrase
MIANFQAAKLTDNGGQISGQTVAIFPAKPWPNSRPICTHNRRWYQERRRQAIVPDHKLPAWYDAVMSLSHQTVRDYLLLLLFTGLRRTEAATLRWEDIDFESTNVTSSIPITSSKALRKRLAARSCFTIFAEHFSQLLKDWHFHMWC